MEYELSTATGLGNLLRQTLKTNFGLIGVIYGFNEPRNTSGNAIKSARD